MQVIQRGKRERREAVVPLQMTPLLASLPTNDVVDQRRNWHPLVGHLNLQRMNLRCCAVCLLSPTQSEARSCLHRASQRACRRAGCIQRGYGISRKHEQTSRRYFQTTSWCSCTSSISIHTSETCHLSVQTSGSTSSSFRPKKEAGSSSKRLKLVPPGRDRVGQ